MTIFIGFMSARILCLSGLSPITGKSVEGADRDWWCIPDFDDDVGDIKAIWEASRFDWMVAFSRSLLMEILFIFTR